MKLQGLSFNKNEREAAPPILYLAQTFHYFKATLNLRQTIYKLKREFYLPTLLYPLKN
jgi:hypothetical protein